MEKPISGERIQKKLANLGFGSRRQIERLIEAGLVKVNNKPATLGQHLRGNELVQVRGRKVVLNDMSSDNDRTRVLAYHKAPGVLCTRKDDRGRPTVFKELPPLKNARWVMVGRLDINTSGLLLFTNNGELANQLMHPRSGVFREYMVRVFGRVTPVMLKQLQTGIELDDGMARFDKVLAICEPLGDDEAVAMNTYYKVVLREGRNREIRRLWEALGCQVSRLKRVAYGGYEMPKMLKPGQTVALNQADIKRLQQQVK